MKIQNINGTVQLKVSRGGGGGATIIHQRPLGWRKSRTEIHPRLHIS